MATNVFGKRLNADIDLVGEGVEEDAGGVSVIQRNRYAARIFNTTYTTTTTAPGTA